METKTVRIQRIKLFSEFLKTRKRYMVLYGGSGAGKSHSIAQRIIQLFYEEDNRRFLITRKTLPSLKISAYQLIIDLLDEYRFP